MNLFRAIVLQLHGITDADLNPNHPRVFDEQFFHETLDQQQYALRRAAIRAMQQYYHQHPEHREQWDNMALVNHFANLERYAARMILPSLGDVNAWGNADVEGRFVAEILGRPFVVVRENGVACIYFNATTMMVEKN